MIFLLTVLFYFTTAASAILAIAAQTWAKDKPILSNRVRIGSLACIVLLLAVAIVKEYVVAVDSQAEKTKNEQLQGKLQGTIETQSNEIGYLRNELKDARVEITDTRTKLVEAQASYKKTAGGIQEHAYQKLYRETYRVLEIVSTMILEASDGWLPANESEFFSRRSINLICRELNSDGPAPILPTQTWSIWVSQNLREYKATLAELIKAHGPQLDTELFTAMSKVEGSMTFWFIVQWQASRTRNNEPFVHSFPPLFCYGDGFLDMVEKDFATLRQLYSETTKAAKKAGIPTTSFPLPTRTQDLGKNRFTSEQLSKWQKEHQIEPQ